MKLRYSQLKKIIPELNEQIVSPERMLEVFDERGVIYHEAEIKENGLYLTDSGVDFIILKRALNYLIKHETLCHEGVHALTMFPAKFLFWRHEIEAKTLSLICMMPRTDLKRLNRIKDQLEPESYELLMQRNSAEKTWNL